MVCHGTRMKRFFKNHPSQIKRYHTFGVPWSELVVKSKKQEKSFAQTLKRAKNCKYCIGVFDSTSGYDAVDISGPTSTQNDDIVAFYNGIIYLLESHSDYLFLIKPKRPGLIDRLSELERIFNLPTTMSRLVGDSDRIVLIDETMDSREVIGVSDLSIAACFTSIVSEALGGQKKAIFYDGLDRNQDTAWGKIPNMVPNSKTKLDEAVQYWLNLNDTYFLTFINEHIVPEIDPYCDGEGLNRFRRHLMQLSSTNQYVSKTSMLYDHSERLLPETAKCLSGNKP